MLYETLEELSAAIKDGKIDPKVLTGFICKGELFIRAGKPEDLLTAYYGSTQACEKICYLLGISDVQHV